MKAIRYSLLVSLLLLSAATAADLPQSPIAARGQPLLDDSFERSELAPWKTLIPSFAVENGVLKGWQTRDDHGAVGRFYASMKDVIVEFRFKLVGSTGFNAVFDDQGYKGSHAGHICRVAFLPKIVRLGDLKEGVMRNDIYEMRKDPARKATAEKMMEGRNAEGRVSLEQDRWHHAVIELRNDELRVCVDGKPVAWLKSDGLAHETKTSFHFSVNGPGVVFDDVRLWKAVAPSS